MDTPKRAVIYTRISRDDTGEGKPLARQQEDCEALAHLRRWEVLASHSDSISAYSGKRRPGWEAVLAMVEAGEVDVIVAWKVDRISRNLRQTVDLIDLAKRTGVAIVTADGDLDLSTEGGRASMAMLSVMATMEVERKGARQKRANEQRRAEGGHFRAGWVPFGYDKDRNIVPEQAAMIRKAAEDVINGGTLRGIAREWRESGVTTPRSSKGKDGWTHNGVKSILTNPQNAAILTYQGKEVGKGEWEPILSEDTFRLVQATLTDPIRRLNSGNGRTPVCLLSGIATCGTCGSKIQAGVSNGHKVYKCNDPNSEHLSTAREEADDCVRQAVTQGETFASTAVLPDLAEREDQDELNAELSVVQSRYDVITASFQRGDTPASAWDQATKAYNEQKQALETRMAAVEGTQRTASVMAKAKVTAFLAMPLTEQRELVRAAVSVTLHPRNRKRNVPMDMQVSVFAADEGRMAPHIAGAHPWALAKKARLYDERIDRAEAMTTGA